MSGGCEIVIALPGLQATLRDHAVRGGQPRLPATEWLLARGDRRDAQADGWRDWLLAGSGLPVDVLARFPAGPCSWAVDAPRVPPGNWARAEPVHLLAGLDHLQLARPAPLPLEAGESQALLATLNAHLGGSGFTLHESPRGGWICSCPPDLAWTAAEPWLAIGRDLRDWLPGGPGGARVRSLVNELQMLLHEHPVNERRVARGLPPVNSVWPWGAGQPAVPQGAATGMLLTDDDWLAGAWRLHGGELSTLDALPAALDVGCAAIRVAESPGGMHGAGADHLESVEERLLVPARAALRQGRVARVALHLGQVVLEVRARARWAFWRRARPLAGRLA